MRKPSAELELFDRQKSRARVASRSAGPKRTITLRSIVVLNLHASPQRIAQLGADRIFQLQSQRFLAFLEQIVDDLQVERLRRFAVFKRSCSLLRPDSPPRGRAPTLSTRSIDAWPTELPSRTSVILTGPAAFLAGVGTRLGTNRESFSWIFTAALVTAQSWAPPEAFASFHREVLVRTDRRVVLDRHCEGFAGLSRANVNTPHLNYMPNRPRRFDWKQCRWRRRSWNTARSPCRPLRRRG